MILNGIRVIDFRHALWLHCQEVNIHGTSAVIGYALVILLPYNILFSDVRMRTSITRAEEGMQVSEFAYKRVHARRVSCCSRD